MSEDPAEDGDSGATPALSERFDVDALPDGFRWAEAIVTGAVTYLVGYLITVAFYWLGPAKLGDALDLMGQLGKVGVVFNTAHNVDVVSSYPLLVIADGGKTSVGSQFDLFRLTEVIGGEPAVPEVVYLAFPVALLLAVGFGRAWALSEHGDRLTTLVSSLGLAVGYGAVAYLGTLVFSYPIGERTIVDGTAIYATQAFEIAGGNITDAVVTFSSDTTGALLSGIAYPLVVGTLGAAIAVAVRSWLR